MDNKNIMPLDVVIHPIKSSIKEKNVEKLGDLLEQLEPNALEKDLAILAIDSHNKSIVELVLEKVSPKYMDDEIISMAIKTQDKDIVRCIKDKIDDRKVFENNKERIQNAILDNGDIKSITGQILSIQDNDSFDCELQEIVMQMYLDVVSDHFKKGALPSNFPMKQFSDSMKESIFFLAEPQCIHLDSLQDRGRFLLLPVYAQHHAFSAYARKLEEDKYSITFVNLGVTDAQRKQGIEPYSEFIYTKEHAKKIFQIFCLKARTEFQDNQRVVDSEFAYHTFKFFSKEKHLLQVNSREQKLGNCFLKNLEKGIRFALAMELSSALDKDFSPESLRVEKQKVKFLNPFFKSGSRINQFPTIQLKKDLVNWLLKNFPMYENEINGEWKHYMSQKEKPLNNPNPLNKEMKTADKLY